MAIERPAEPKNAGRGAADVSAYFLAYEGFSRALGYGYVTCRTRMAHYDDARVCHATSCVATPALRQKYILRIAAEDGMRVTAHRTRDFY